VKRIVLFLVLAACTRPATRIHGWRDDLTELAAQISSHHPGVFAKVKEADWRKAITELDGAIIGLDDAHILVGMERIVAMVGDSHTRLWLPRKQLYPIAFLWFDDGVFVGGAGDPSVIGHRVTAVGNRSIDNALATVGSLVPYENDQNLRNEVPALLSDPVVLEGTDLVLGDTADFTLDDGRVLHLRPGAGVSLQPPKSLPLHLQGPTQLAYWNKYVEDQHLIYFQYNACENDPKVGPFLKFAKDTLEFADTHRVDRFVIDLRNNGGGNSLVIEPLVLGLEQRPSLRGRIFVLIGRTTFSSAVMNATELKDRVGATLVGTPTGGNPNGYGEVKQFELPYSHLKGQYSTKLWTDDHYKGNTVPPDIAVHVTSADWFGGKDPAMDAVLAAPIPDPIPTPTAP